MSGSATGAPDATPRSLPVQRTLISGSRLSAAVPIRREILKPSAPSAIKTACVGSGFASPTIGISNARATSVAMSCRRSISGEWRSATMQTVSDFAGRFALPSAPPPGGWRSSTMRMLGAVVTPGTSANVATSLAVTTVVIPAIPNRALAAAAGFAAGSVLGG